mgnify:CR=1 FL=1
MANRRITDLPAISSAAINDDDLLMVVDVAEVDPGLKNKKLTFTNTKQYLNNYYLQLTGGTVAGNLNVGGNLSISGLFTPTVIQVSGTGTFAQLVVTGNAEIKTVLSGTIITGGAINGLNVNATTGNIQTLIVGNETVRSEEHTSEL